MSAYLISATGAAVLTMTIGTEVWLDSEGSLKVEEQQFGPWFCAPPESRIQKKCHFSARFFSQNERKLEHPKGSVSSKASLGKLHDGPSISNGTC